MKKTHSKSNGKERRDNENEPETTGNPFMEKLEHSYRPSSYECSISSGSITLNISLSPNIISKIRSYMPVGVPNSLKLKKL